MDVKRIGYLFFLGLLIGVTIVFLRTVHRQNVYEMTQLAEQERQIRQMVWQQQVRISGALEAPGRIQAQLQRLQVPVCARGEEPSEQTVLASAGEH